jgi:hypothetical protein
MILNFAKQKITAKMKRDFIVILDGNNVAFVTS